MKRTGIRNLLSTGLVIGLAIALGACASSSDKTETGSTAAAKEETEKPVPPGSKLSKVETGMSQQQVRNAIGEPDDIRGYPTGKNWIPFYFGGDTYRMDWLYSGEGKVIFSNPNRWSRNMKVKEIHYDPDQP
ncbi:MAG TPA: hypothetical protein ENI85_13940 [Deltaproteobacteria bacterium]|nr:hypothetical protein [Deltaproteobacteria bacterium]